MGGKTGGSHKKHLYYDCGARTTSARVRVEKCCAHARRADWVDGAVWSWIKSLLTDENQLTKGLRDYQARRESESAPLRERIATIDGMLADNRAQMAKILDLYLTGDFPREMLAERKGRLQDTITKLEAERNRIIGQLEARTLSEDDIDTLLRFVGKVSKGLAEAEKSFAERRRIIDLLDVRGVFVPEDGEEKLDAECVIDKKRLALLSMSS